jgi:proline racemase
MRWQQTITVVGAHAEGEVGNVITDGVVDVPGATMFEKKQWLERDCDEVRRRLIFEPRGGPCHAVNILLPPTQAEADVGFVIMEATKYPAMSGSNAICVATVVLETGIVPMVEPLTRLVMESPAGLIDVECVCRDGKVEQVRFKNVAAFVQHRDCVIEVDGFGPLRLDVCYGGIYYAIVDARDLGFEVRPAEACAIARCGRDIRAACNAQIDSVHPLDSRIHGVTNVAFVTPPIRDGQSLRARNAVVCGHGRIDRSPCGTGTSARLALLYATEQIAIGQSFEHESIIGTWFNGEVVDTTSVGPYGAVVSTIAGQAWITGVSQYGVDPTDPLSNGHTLSDVWFSD